MRARVTWKAPSKVADRAPRAIARTLASPAASSDSEVANAKTTSLRCWIALAGVSLVPGSCCGNPDTRAWISIVGGGHPSRWIVTNAVGHMTAR